MTIPVRVIYCAVGGCEGWSSKGGLCPAHKIKRDNPSDKARNREIAAARVRLKLHGGVKA